MRAFGLILLLGALSGCRGPGGEKLDYRSTNREGYRFFRETIAGDYRRAKGELKQDVRFSSRAPGNRKLRKEGRAFAWKSTWEQTGSNTKQAWQGLLAELTGKNSNLRLALFGFLDSGSAKKNSRYP